jgi:hypothetical protein
MSPSSMHICSPAHFMQDMKSLGEYVQKAAGSLPKLVLVILPISSADIYLAVKQFGDVHVGVCALTVLKKIRVILISLCTM